MADESGFAEFIIGKIDTCPGNIRTFRLFPKDGGAQPERKPGQYVSLKIGNLERAYSLSGPIDAEYLEVTVRLRGEFTTKLFSMREGETILVSKPMGRFVLSGEKLSSGKGIVFLAGGVGITPFLSMLDYLSKAKESPEVTLIYGSRRPSEIIMGERINELLRNLPKCKVIHTVDSGEPGWEGKVGFIGKELVAESVKSPKDSLFFICGPPPMVRSLVSALKELGVPVQSITLEGW